MNLGGSAFAQWPKTSKAMKSLIYPHLPRWFLLRLLGCSKVSLGAINKNIYTVDISRSTLAVACSTGAFRRCVHPFPHSGASQDRTRCPPVATGIGPSGWWPSWGGEVLARALE